MCVPLFRALPCTARGLEARAFPFFRPRFRLGPPPPPSKEAGALPYHKRLLQGKVNSCCWRAGGVSPLMTLTGGSRPPLATIQRGNASATRADLLARLNSARWRWHRRGSGQTHHVRAVHHEFPRVVVEPNVVGDKPGVELDVHRHLPVFRQPLGGDLERKVVMK